MFWMYVLRSLRSGRYYIGYTADIAARLREHNGGRVRATTNYRPWEIFHVESFLEEKEAIRRERQLKSWKSRVAIERLKFGNKIEDPRFHDRATRG